MKCPNCQNEKALYLVNGGCNVCNGISNNGPYKLQKRRGRPIGSYEPKIQRKETKALQAKCLAIMGDLKLPPYRFAKLVGLTPSAFYRWIHGEFSYHRQPKFNEKVIKALERNGYE